MMRMLPSRTTWMAGSASGLMRRYHWSSSSGSITVPDRWQCPTECVYGSCLTSCPCCSSSCTRRLRDSCVAEDGLRPRRRHRNPLVVAFDDRVAHVRQLAVDLLVIHLQIGQHRLAVLAPVGDAVAAVDQPLVEQMHERGAHGSHVVR